MIVFLCFKHGDTIYVGEPKKVVETIPIETDVIALLEEEVRETKHWDENTSDNTIQLSQADAWRLMKIAVVEDNTDAESQAHIMACILQRVADPNFPNSIEEVIRQKDTEGRYQFSSVKEGKYDRAMPNIDSHYALAMLEAGNVKTDALFFEASYAKGTWQSKNLLYLFTVGGTRYYK